MAILCCCSQFRPKKTTPRTGNEGEVQSYLPIRPPPARLAPTDYQPPPLPSQSTTARSSLTNPLPGAAADASVQLAEMIIDDSDDDQGESGMVQDGRDRGTSTLQVVKAAIRRHLSQDSLSRQSETEEQIARRAEVKRLMRKRIQEELQSEPDDFLSEVSTSQYLGVGSINLLGNGPRDTIEFTVDETRNENEPFQPKAHQLTYSVETEQTSLPRSLSKQSSVTLLRKENRPVENRPISLQCWVETHFTAPTTDSHQHLRQRSSLPNIPSSSVLHPVRVPSLHDASSFASWRLSLSAGRLADLFTLDRSLSVFRPSASSLDTYSVTDTKDQESLKHMRNKSSRFIHGIESTSRVHSRQVSFHSDNPSQIPVSRSLIRGESPVGLWLQTQSQQFQRSDYGSDSEFPGRPSSKLIEQPGELERLGLEETITIPKTTEWSDDICGRNKIYPPGPFPSPHIRHRSRQAATCCKTICPCQVGEAVPRPSLVSTITTISEPSVPLHRPMKVGVWSPVGNTVRKGLRLPHFKWNLSSNNTNNTVNSTLFSVSNSCVLSPGSTNPKSQPAVTETGSDTSSLLRREAELGTIEQRFRDSYLRKGPLAPVKSKFHEVFYESHNAANKNQLLSRLYPTVSTKGMTTAIENYDGDFSGHVASVHVNGLKNASQGAHYSLSSDHAHLKVPPTKHGNSRAKSSGTSPKLSNSNKPRRPRGFSSSKDGDETAEMWKRALRAGSASRPYLGSTPSQVPVPRTEGGQDSNKWSPKVSQPSEDGKCSEMESDIHSPMCNKISNQESEQRFWQSLARSNTVLEEWARQLESQEQQAKTKFPPLLIASHALGKTSGIPPASWARFSSINREERNASAGEADKVKSKDFAVNGISAAGSIMWTTDKTAAGMSGHKTIVRSFSDKFTQPFKSRLSRLATGRFVTPPKDTSMQGERRSSIKTSGDLEYPELELLPTAGGYKDLCALSREINEMKGLANARIHASSDDIGTGCNLTDKMTSLIQDDDPYEVNSSKASENSSITRGQPNCLRLHPPGTPAAQDRRSDASNGKNFTGSSGERYATPLSHISFGPDSPSHPNTPESGFRPPTTTSQPNSINSNASKIRRASMSILEGTFNLVISSTRSKSLNGGGSVEKISRPWRTTPV